MIKKSVWCIDNRFITSLDLFIPKLNVCGLELSSVKLTQDYTSNFQQRTKVDSEFSPWKKIISGIPRYDLESHGVQFTSCADENIPFLVKDNITDAISA